MAHLYLSAAHKSSGKTTVSLGLCAALRHRGLQVAPFKKGPDYIDPMWLARASGRACYNLDFQLMSREEIRAGFARGMTGADIGIVEGNKGLYDGLDLEGGNSNAALAKLLDAPVVLVLDARGMTRGIAPLILGYQAFDRDVNIAGVILNNLGGSRHESKLRAVIEHYTDARVFGAVQHDPRLSIAERHLGLVPGNEAGNAADKVALVADCIARHCDLDALIDLARQAPASPDADRLPASGECGEVRIAIARDRAFGFYYQEDLERMEAAGARLVPFDTLTAPRLPEADGLLIGGGFPEMFLRELEGNAALRQDIERKITQGLPAHAECGGLMYLARSIRWQDRAYAMAGVIPGEVVMHDRPVGRGYARLRDESGEGEVNAHEFHYSALERLSPGVPFRYRVMRGHGVDGTHDGIQIHNLVASYCHMKSSTANPWAERFVRRVREHARARRAAA